MGRLALEAAAIRAEHARLLAQLEMLDGRTQAAAVALFDAYQEAFAEEVALGHFSLVASLIESTPRPDVRGLLVGAFAGVWGRHAPAEASHWLRSLPIAAPLCAPIMAEVVSTWAGRDPQAAAAFAESLETSPVRSAALAAAVSQWAARDVAAAGEWLAAQTTDGDFDQAISALLRDSAWDGYASPAAMRLAETLSDAGLRLEAMADIARRWLARDSVAARHHLAGSSFVLAHTGPFATALAARKDLGDE